MPGAEHFERALDASFNSGLLSLRTAQQARSVQIEQPSPQSLSLSPTGSVNARRRGGAAAVNVDAPPGTDTSEEKKVLKPTVPIGQVVKQLSSLIKVLLFAATITAIFISVFLILTLIEFYSSSGKTRLEYLKYGAAPRLAAESTVATFSGLLMAKNAFITSLDTLTYTDEFDYATVETIVTPLFSEFPELHSIDIAFTESDYGIYISRYTTGEVFMQSDSDTCHSISNHACVLHTDLDHSTKTLPWYTQMTEAYVGNVTSLWSGPEALIQRSSSAQETLTIKTGVSLVFIHPFKYRTTQIVCKVTTATTGLRAILGDAVLVDQGDHRLFVVNRAGQVVAGSGVRTGEYIKLTGVSGNTIVYKQLHELGGPLEGFSEVDLSSENVLETVLPGGYLGISYPFDDGYLRLVTVSELDPFVNRKVQVLIVIGIIASGLPYLVGLGLMFVFALKQRAAHNRMIQRERDMLEAQLALSAAKARGNLVGALATAGPTAATAGRRRR